MDASIAIAHTRLANLSDALFEGRLSGATGSVVIGRGVELEHMAGSTDRYIPIAAHLINQLALADRLQSLRRRASCNISLSRLRSATTFRSLPFSSSSCLSRRISVGSNPSYRFFQLKYVAWLIPALRQISATGIPSAPCLSMNAFWASENLEAFIVLRSSQAGNHRGKL